MDAARQRHTTFPCLPLHAWLLGIRTSTKSQRWRLVHGLGNRGWVLISWTRRRWMKGGTVSINLQLATNLSPDPWVLFPIFINLYFRALHYRFGDEDRRLMHLVPAPAVRLMKRRVLSRPGVNRLMIIQWSVIVIMKLLSGINAWSYTRIRNLIRVAHL